MDAVNGINAGAVMDIFALMNISDKKKEHKKEEEDISTAVRRHSEKGCRLHRINEPTCRPRSN